MCYFTFLNPYSYLIARKNKKIFKKFVLKIDGILLVKFLNIVGINIKRESFDMTSVAPLVFKKSIKEKKKIFIIGTEPELIDKAIENIKIEFKELNIIGYRNGYFKNPEERDRILKYIVNLHPDIVICGMGTPLQEQFLLDLKNKGWNGIGYTCGGFLHQIAKKNLNYYPPIFDKLHLRWLYRIIDEPKLWKRYFIKYPIFILVFFYDLIQWKIYKKENLLSLLHKQYKQQ